jgi:cadmium resistance protein CadD (predicted permease)
MSYLSVIILGMVVFASTNIDDLLVLLIFFADRRYKTRHVVLGQYLGFSGLLAVSFICCFLAIAVPARWLGLLGLWPLSIGLYRLYQLAKKKDSQSDVFTMQTSTGTFHVAFVTLANGGDNICAYRTAPSAGSWPGAGCIRMRTGSRLGCWARRLTSPTANRRRRS